jgi:hypothetical protein
MPDPIKINLNDTIRFRIRPRGVKLYEDHYTKYGLTPPPLKREGETIADRMIEMQLWEFANIFGPGMMMGADPPVETTVEIR